MDNAISTESLVETCVSHTSNNRVSWSCIEHFVRDKYAPAGFNAVAKALERFALFSAGKILATCNVRIENSSLQNSFPANVVNYIWDN